MDVNMLNEYFLIIERLPPFPFLYFIFCSSGPYALRGKALS